MTYLILSAVWFGVVLAVAWLCYQTGKHNGTADAYLEGFRRGKSGHWTPVPTFEAEDRLRAARVNAEIERTRRLLTAIVPPPFVRPAGHRENGRGW